MTGMNGAARTQSGNGAAPAISTVRNALDTATRDFDPQAIINTIRTGGKVLRTQIESIRSKWRSELDTHGDIKLAKKAIDPAKKQLPAVIWSGTFTERDGDKLVNHSGLLCADLDNLGARLKEVREKLTCSPYAWAVFISPSGDGLKVVFRVPADGVKHHGSYRAIEKYVKELVSFDVDQSCKDVARLCFLSYDPQVFHNPDAREIEPLPEPEKPQRITANVDLNKRQQVVNEILVAVAWESETSGFTTCPGKHLHTTGDGERDCKVNLDQVPTVYCFHNTCRGILDVLNHEIRSRIGKAEHGERPPADSKTDNTESHREEKAKPSPWTKAKSAPEFCAEEDKEIEGLAKDLIVPGAITCIAAPRGLGKTLVAHSVAVQMAHGGSFRGQSVKSIQVLLLDRDNPRHVVRKRLKGWGAIDAHKLRVMTREKVPDLKDKAAWESFPVKDYDVIIVDSVGSFTEGVTEKEGKETTQILATLLDLIHKGPAVLLLTNCTKDALNTRGRGEWQDRVDIQYEVRDATGFTPSGKKDWWQELPEAGESAWADRAARRKNRIDYQLAFVPSKFRLGAQPDPFCLELRLPPEERWTLEDVTEQIVKAGEDTIKEVADKKQQQEESAVNALAEVVESRYRENNPMLKTEAETYLNKEMELSRKRSRELIGANNGTRWTIQEAGGKGAPKTLVPVNTPAAAAKMNHEGKIAAAHAQSGRRNAPLVTLCQITVFQTPYFRRRGMSVHRITSYPHSILAT